MRGVGFEEEEAIGAIRECIVAVVGVVPVPKSCEVPVDSADQSVTAVGAGREGEELADVEGSHSAGDTRYGRLRCSTHIGRWIDWIISGMESDLNRSR